MPAADEIVAIVNERNEVVGSATRREMRARKLPHRSTYILVFNSQGGLYVQKRTETKDVFPGYFDPTAGGVVLFDETYEQGAARELEEELGIRNVPLVRHFTHCYRDEDVCVWGALFTCSFDGPMVLQEEEIVSGEFLPVSVVLQRSKKERFTPDGMLMLSLYLSIQDPSVRQPHDDRK
jgi:isopentenyldiphosphate isomerase